MLIWFCLSWHLAISCFVLSYARSVRFQSNSIIYIVLGLIIITEVARICTWDDSLPLEEIRFVPVWISVRVSACILLMMRLHTWVNFISPNCLNSCEEYDYLGKWMGFCHKLWGGWLLICVLGSGFAAPILCDQGLLSWDDFVSILTASDALLWLLTVMSLGMMQYALYKTKTSWGQNQSSADIRKFHLLLLFTVALMGMISIVIGLVISLTDVYDRKDHFVILIWPVVPFSQIFGVIFFRISDLFRVRKNNGDRRGSINLVSLNLANLDLA